MSIRVSDYTSGGGNTGGVSVTFATETQAKEGTATHVAMNPARTKDAISKFAKSPYQMWLDGGGVGTEQDFLKSISGIKYFDTNDERNDYFTNNPTERFQGVMIFVNGLYQKWNGVSWENLSNITINKNHFFINETTKNEYFINHPTELQSGLIININGQFHIYFNGSWHESTSIILGKTDRDDLVSSANDVYLDVQYNEKGLMTYVLKKLSNNIFIQEQYDYLYDLLLTTVYNRSYNGTDFEVIGMNIYNYNAEELPTSTIWWDARASVGDQELVKTYFLNNINISHDTTWDILVNDQDMNFNTVINNTESFDIIKLSQEANDAIFVSSNAVAILNGNSPIVVPQLNASSTRVQASSQYDTNNAWKVFDRDFDSSWITLSNNNEWISYEFDQPIWLYNLLITPSTDQTSPKNCKIEYFDEVSSTWMLARSFTMSSDFIPEQSFNIAVPVKASKWRLYLFDNYGNNSMIRTRRMQYFGFY